MTREEAIEVIKLALAQVEWDYPMDYAEAFDMAIKALEQEPTTKNNLGVDCISRKQAIEEADKLCLETGYDNEKVEEMLRELPSVTPQEPCDKCEVGNPCLYCKHEFEPQESEDNK